jgi:hypothetical protein
MSASRTYRGLPGEILEKICFFSKCKYGYTGTLAILCLTSKRLCDIARPILYREPITKYSVHYFSNYDADAGAECPLLQLMRTLLQRPDLAAIVRHLIFNPWLVHELPNTSAEMLQDAATKFGLELPVDWREPAGDPYTEPGQALSATLAVLLMLLPNLEVLRLQLSDTFNFGLLEQIASQKNGGLNPRLPNLKKLFLAHNDSEGGCVLDSVGPLVALAPNLEVLGCDQGAGFGEDGNADFPTMGKLRKLLLRQCAMTREELEDLVCKAPALEVFVHQPWGTATVSDDCHESNLNGVLAALSSVRRGIKTLVIDLSEREHRDEDFRPIDPRGSIEHLNQFTGLKTLALSANELLPAFEDGFMSGDSRLVQVLPQSIESFVVLGGATKLQSACIQLAQESHSDGKFPYLKRVAMNTGTDLNPFRNTQIETPNADEALEALMKETGDLACALNWMVLYT